MEKKRVLLICPRNLSNSSYIHQGHIQPLTGKVGTWINIALPTVAALTPREHFEVRVLDENCEAIDFDAPWDIVGLGLKPTMWKRARDIAAEFRKRGRLVVAGGSSASVSPELWRDQVDVLFIGEAEEIWPRFLEDYLRGDFKAEYRQEGRVDLTESPIPDFSSLPPQVISQFTGGVIQTSRGCPYQCEYCNVTTYLGRKMGFKTSEQVVAELEQLHRLGFRMTWVADDDFSVNRRRAKEVMRAIRAWNRTKKSPMIMMTSVSIQIANDEEFMELAAEAGIQRFIIGLETENQDSLKEIRKHQNVRKDTIADIKRLHAHGILVCSGCMLGFDHDDLGIFERQFSFFQEAAIPNIQVYPVQALDGTPLKARMEKEGRYHEPDRNIPVAPTELFTIEPAQMSIPQLRQGVYWLVGRFYDWRAFEQRVVTFFERYEASPKRKTLQHPGAPIRLSEMGTMGRLARHMLTAAEPEERKMFFRLMRHASRSSHPQRFHIAVGSYMNAKNILETVRAANQDFRQLGYPQPQRLAAVA